MATREIERSKWNEEFNRLSREHLGWVISVEVIGEEMGAQIESRQMPFGGISADFKDKENRIEIGVGASSQAHVTHAIIEPVLVYLKQNEMAEDEALEIEAADGTKTIVRFRTSNQAQSAGGLLTE